MELLSVRSLLFVPGDSPKKLAKAAGAAADGVIIDWEDAVAAHSKQAARSATLQALPNLLARKIVVLVRPNQFRREWWADDLRALRDCAADGLVIPKCESPGDVEEILSLLPESMAAVPLVESPCGLLNAPGLAACSPRVRALIFGAEDYSVKAQILRSEDERELLYARSRMVASARAYRKHVFDSPAMEYRDLAVVRRTAWRSRRLGFTGQAAIHPAQAEVINDVFLPSEQEVADALAVLGRHEKHRGGAHGVDGVLEDMPMVRTALNVISSRQRLVGRTGSARGPRPSGEERAGAASETS